MAKKVPINPSIKIYNILRHLSYQPWYAFAEYIDNSIQSFLDHEELLKKINPNYKLKIEITFDKDEKCVKIEDNAAGIIAEDEYQIQCDNKNRNYIPKSLSSKFDFDFVTNNGEKKYRDERWSLAFKLAEEKEDSGFNRFGMGMKTASLWLCDHWRVRTKAIGDNIIRTVVWDTKSVTENDQTELDTFEQKSADLYSCFTIIELRTPTDNMPDHHLTIERMIDYIEAIYQNYIKRDDVEIFINTKTKQKKLEYNEIEILEAPLYTNMSGNPVKWKKEIDIDLGNNQKMWGFVAISKKMSNKKAGFSLFYNDRIIEGAGDKKWIPEFMGGINSNSPERGGIFGEIHVEGFQLTHTKDRFIGSEDFNQTFNFSVKGKINDPEFPLLKQAKHYKRSETTEEKKKKSKKSSEKVKKTVQGKRHDSKNIIKKNHVISGEEINKLVEINQEVNGKQYAFKITINSDEKSSSLFTWSEDGHVINLFINRSFPLFTSSNKIDEETIVPIIMSMCIAEIQYESSGTITISTFRYLFEDNLNTFLS